MHHARNVSFQSQDSVDYFRKCLNETQFCGCFLFVTAMKQIGVLSVKPEELQGL